MKNIVRKVYWGAWGISLVIGTIALISNAKATVLDTNWQDGYGENITSWFDIGSTSSGGLSAAVQDYKINFEGINFGLVSNYIYTFSSAQNGQIQAYANGDSFCLGSNSSIIVCPGMASGHAYDARISGSSTNKFDCKQCMGFFFLIRWQL